MLSGKSLETVRLRTFPIIRTVNLPSLGNNPRAQGTYHPTKLTPSQASLIGRTSSDLKKKRQRKQHWFYFFNLFFVCFFCMFCSLFLAFFLLLPFLPFFFCSYYMWATTPTFQYSIFHYIFSLFLLSLSTFFPFTIIIVILFFISSPFFFYLYYLVHNLSLLPIVFFNSY
jgi:hypothetical protein